MIGFTDSFVLLLLSLQSGEMKYLRWRCSSCSVCLWLLRSCALTSMETISPLVSLLGKPGSRIEGGPGESVLPVRSVLFVPKEPAVTEPAAAAALGHLGKGTGGTAAWGLSCPAGRDVRAAGRALSRQLCRRATQLKHLWGVFSERGERIANPKRAQTRNTKWCSFPYWVAALSQRVWQFLQPRSRQGALLAEVPN